MPTTHAPLPPRISPSPSWERAGVRVPRPTIPHPPPRVILALPPLVILRSEATKNLRPWPRRNVRRFLAPLGMTRAAARNDTPAPARRTSHPTRATSPFPLTPPIPYPSPMPTAHAPVHTGSSFLRRQSLPLRRQGNLAPALIPLMPSLSDYHPRSAEGPLTLRLSKGEPGEEAGRVCPICDSFHTPHSAAHFPYLRLPAIRFAHLLRGVRLLSAPGDSNPPPRNKPQAGAPLRRPFEPNESKLPPFHRKSIPESAPRHPRHGGAAKTRWDESNRLECPPHPSRPSISRTWLSPLWMA